MFRLQKIDHHKGFVAGIIGGAFGVIALRAYGRWLSPDAFKHIDGHDQPVKVALKLPAIPPVLGLRRHSGEAATAAAGRIAYSAVMGSEPQTDAERERLRDLVLWGWGIALGASYGATRTTTRWRDIAGGFFFGIRIFLGAEMAVGLSGLQPDPRGWTLRKHLVWLSSHWVYSFVATNVTRVLYRLLPDFE